MGVAAAPSRARFGFLTLPSYSMIACVNAIEALRMANHVTQTEAYRWSVLTLDGAPATASNGLTLGAARLDQAEGLDCVFVCGGLDVRHATSRPLAAALRGLSHRGLALGALCTGTFALAEAGLLNGYRCAIHWENLSAIREEFPGIDFVEDIYAIDRDRLTCTGGIAPLDMMLTLIGMRHGAGVAGRVSAQFIVERSRAGAERQPISALPPGARGHPKLEAAIRLLEARGDRPASVADIAQGVELSVRQVERLFRHHLGQSPAAFALQLRLNRAQRLLRQTSMPIVAISAACGFSSSAHFSSAYSRHFSRSPRAERAPASAPSADRTGS
jgi:transcriptional regulator GlxA family with amidase domain